MTLKVIHKTQKQTTKEKTDNYDYVSKNEETIKDLYQISQLIIEQSKIVMSNIDMQKMIQMDDEELQQATQHLEKIMNIFAFVIGKKTSILEAVLEATKIVEKIQKIAKNNGIDLTKNTTEQEQINILDEKHIQEMALLMRNLGIDKVCQEYNERVKEFEEQNGTFHYNDNIEDNKDQKQYTEYNVEQEEEQFRNEVQQCYNLHKNDIFIFDIENEEEDDIENDNIKTNSSQTKDTITNSKDTAIDKEHTNTT